MKLYYSPGACSLVPHILLKDVALPFVAERVNTKAHTFGDGKDFYAVNPKGSVPVLELDDGSRLTEGPIIAQYICDRAGRTDLMPAAGSMARYRVMEWQNYVTSELHKSFSPLFGTAFDASARPVFVEILLKKFRWVDSQLAGKDYLTGSEFTAADAYLFTVTRWAEYVNVDLGGLQSLQAFQQRVSQRPAVRAALLAEGLVKEGA